MIVAACSRTKSRRCIPEALLSWDSQKFTPYAHEALLSWDSQKYRRVLQARAYPRHSSRGTLKNSHHTLLSWDYQEFTPYAHAIYTHAHALAGPTHDIVFFYSSHASIHLTFNAPHGDWTSLHTSENLAPWSARFHLVSDCHFCLAERADGSPLLRTHTECKARAKTTQEPETSGQEVGARNQPDTRKQKLGRGLLDHGDRPRRAMQHQLAPFI